MKISGPFKDPAKKGQPKPWYLSYFAPNINSGGTLVLGENGAPALKRHRPYYETKAAAEADKSRIADQHAATGSGNFLFDRKAAEDYDAAQKIVGTSVTMAELARFWRLHHPDQEKKKLKDLLPLFLKDVEERLGQERHWKDLKSRGGAFVGKYCERYPDTITRNEILEYVRTPPDTEPRTKRNHKTVICEFFNWLLDQRHVLVNPAAGIKKRMLPKETKKEIRFLTLDQVTRYLRTAERYDPELVAHEVVQLIAGVRADDEMADFQAEFVLTATRQIVIPAAIAKTGVREVIDGVEENFWDWWSKYGPKSGLLRPKNFFRRWDRLRVLASATDDQHVEALAKLPIKQLLRRPESKAAIKTWPRNARRRTFCTYHVAMHQSAEKTVLIMRHRGSSYTLHNSYRGLGITQDKGKAYFEIRPSS